MEAFQDDHWPPGHLEDVVEALRPTYNLAVRQRGGDLIDKMVRLNVALTVDRLRKDKDLAPLLGPQLDTVGGVTT